MTALLAVYGVAVFVLTFVAVGRHLRRIQTARATQRDLLDNAITLAYAHGWVDGVRLHESAPELAVHEVRELVGNQARMVRR